MVPPPSFGLTPFVFGKRAQYKSRYYLHGCVFLLLLGVVSLVLAVSGTTNLASVVCLVVCVSWLRIPFLVYFCGLVCVCWCVCVCVWRVLKISHLT